MNTLSHNYDKKITFLHYLIIRFSINLAGANIFRKDRNPLNPEYLEKRFSLFTQFCLPSLKNQTNKNFVLILIIDPELKMEYRERLLVLTRNIGFSTQLVEYKGSFDLNYLLNPNEIDMIKKTQNRTGKQYICTTRLDDDDALNPNYFYYTQREIQALIDTKLFFKPFIHTLVYGNYLMVKNKKCYLRKIRKPRLACGLSLINTLNDKTTIYSKSHHGWDTDEYPQYSNLHENMYFVLIHEKNDSQRYEQEKDNLDDFISVSCGKPIYWYFNYVNGLLETYSNPGLKQLQTKMNLKNMNKSKSTLAFSIITEEQINNKKNKNKEKEKVIHSASIPKVKTYKNSTSSASSNTSNNSVKSNSGNFRYDITKLKGTQKINKSKNNN